MPRLQSSISNTSNTCKQRMSGTRLSSMQIELINLSGNKSSTTRHLECCAVQYFKKTSVCSRCKEGVSTEWKELHKTSQRMQQLQIRRWCISCSLLLNIPTRLITWFIIRHANKSYGGLTNNDERARNRNRVAKSRRGKSLVNPVDDGLQQGSGFGFFCSTRGFGNRVGRRWIALLRAYIINSEHI